MSVSAGLPDGVVFCDDAASLSDAVAAIKDAGGCVKDCEGHDLGDPAGRLTLIQIIPIDPHAPQIFTLMSYLVDVLALDDTQQQAALDPLKQVLEDPFITKVLYDCRNDAGALWHEQQCRLQVRVPRLLFQSLRSNFLRTSAVAACNQFKATLPESQSCLWLAGMQGVLDLQLLDLLEWKSSASKQERLVRLKGYTKSDPQKTPFHYRNVYMVTRAQPHFPLSFHTLVYGL